MREFKRERGFFTIAQNSVTDYLRLAYGMALSLRATQREVPWLSIGVTSDMTVPDKYRAVFDEVIELPWNDLAAHSLWKLENEWKVFHCTPYERTIKLDADMLFVDDITEWWKALEERRQDVSFCTTARTYRGDIVTSDFYRKTFTANGLPNVYTAFMYFKANPSAQELFEMAEQIFRNWEQYSFEFLDETRPKEVSTDVVFALAAVLLDRVDDFTVQDTFPSFVHMKSRLQGWKDSQISEDWTRHIGGNLTSDLRFMIGRYRQVYPVHYHIKDFLTDTIIRRYERHLGL